MIFLTLFFCDIMVYKSGENMGLFDFLKTNNKVQNNNVVVNGKIDCNEVFLNSEIVGQLKQKYIAFDIETTGLDSNQDRIVEIGAVLFENRKQISKFGTLVNPNKKISEEAMKVNNISNETIQNSPLESDVYAKFVSFLGNALSGDIVICAHNAKFDISFLKNTLERLGYSGKISYIDTLTISRDLLYLDNYKQGTVSDYFNIENKDSHRAISDAEVCGEILNRFLDFEIKQRKSKNVPHNIIELDQYEKIILSYIIDIINNKGYSCEYLGARKNTSGYVDVCCLYKFLRFKFAKSGKYLIIPSSYKNRINLPFENCNVSEGGTDYIRVYYKNLDDLKTLNDIFILEYSNSYNSMNDYIDGSSRREQNALDEISNMYKLTVLEAEEIVEEEMINNTLNDYCSDFNIEPKASRDDIIINPINDRVSLNDIKNLNDWEKGFDDGYKYWESGEELRKSGNYLESIKQYDLSRYNGYESVVLYDSYAMAYHQLKDYDNEISILDEGIDRLSDKYNVSSLVSRRDKVVQILYKQNIKEIELIAKQKLKEEQKRKKEEQKEKEKILKAEQRKNNPTIPSTARAILQLDDAGNVLNLYPTIAEAVRQTGINSKSIRNAANGVQKHAGGYCWKYKDENEV